MRNNSVFSVVLISFVLSILFLSFSYSSADPFPPYWNGGTGPSIHFPPAAWPNEPPNPADCTQTCGDWKPYTRFQNSIGDPRIQDPSNGGTSPQNYVNVASSCIDKELPSIYYNLFKHPTDQTQDVVFFRWRVEQIANTYATGPSPGNFRATSPWNSALWTVLFDLDGDGYRDNAAHLDGSSGGPSEEIDRIFGIWGEIPTQSIDYTSNPDIYLIAHNPTAFIGPTDRILNFQDSLTPVENWPNGSSETTWDYGTTRSKLVSTSSCSEYFIDYQIPVALLDASGVGGPTITRDTPISMIFCTANSLNNPFQKDCAINKEWIGDGGKPAPFGDYLSFNQEDPYSQPIISSVTATAPSSCPGNYTLTAKVQDVLAVVNGEVVPSIQAVDFYYYYDVNGDGIDNDGESWTFAASAALVSGSLNTWTASWDSTSLAKGQYLIGVQAVDDNTLVDDDIVPSGVDNRTFSYVIGDSNPGTENWIYVGGVSYAPVPQHIPPMIPSLSEDWYGNPSVTGVQTALVGLALNTCGVAPTITKTAGADMVVAGGTVDFTITIDNPLATVLTVTRIIDTLPEGFSYAGGSTTGDFGTDDPSIIGQVLTWDFSPAETVAASGGSATLTFTATASSIPGSYQNTADATTSFGVITSDPVTVGVGAPRLTVSKSANGVSFNPGDTITYTMTYSNDSPVNVTNVQITDPIPAGMTYVPDSLIVEGVSQTDANDGDSAYYDAAAVPGPEVVFTLGSLASGEGPFTVSFQVTVDDPYPDAAPIPAINTGTISSDETADASASVSVFINAPRPNMVIQKDANVTSVAPGGNVIFTINYENIGNADAQNVFIDDTTPLGFTYQASSLPPTADPGVGGSGLIQWTLGTVASGASGSFTVTMQATAAAANPTVNTVTINWDTLQSATDSFTVGVIGGACSTTTYYFHDTDNTSPGTADMTLPAGTLRTYTATINNSLPPVTIGEFFDTETHTSPITLSNVTADIYITHPSKNLTFYVELYDNAVAPANLMFSGSAPSTGNKTNGLVLVNLSTVTKTTLPLGNQLVWVVRVSTTSGGGDFNVNLLFDTGGSPSSSSFCESPTILVLDKQVNMLSAQSGDTLVYTIKYSNPSASAVTNVQISDTTPAGTTFVNAVPAPAVSPGVGGTGLVRWDIGGLAAGASGSVTLTLNIDQPLDTAVLQIDNTATLTSNETSPINDSAKTVITRPDVTLSKSADITLLNVLTADTVTYSLTVLNSGSGQATNVTVNDILPDQPYFIYVSGSTEVDGIPVADPVTVNPGTDNDQFTLNIGTIAAGASKTVTFQMQVIPTAPDGVTTRDNLATVSDDQTTGTRTSNTVTVSISSNPNLNLSKSANPSAGLNPGDTVTFTLLLSNSGSGDAFNVIVSDPVPDLLTFGSITQGSGSFDAVNNRVVFDAGTLAAGASTTLEFTATVNPLPSGNTTITNIATASASNSSSRTAEADVVASANPDLTLGKTGPAQAAFPTATLIADVSNDTVFFVDNPSQLTVGQYVSVGGTAAMITDIAGNAITVDTPVTGLTGGQVTGSITYNLTYQNIGNATATSVTLTDTLPPGVTFVSATGGGTEAGGIVTWSLGDIAPDAGGNVQVVIIPGGAGTITDNASITCTNCAGPVNDSLDTQIGGLIVSKRTTTPVTPAPGTVTYIIEIENTLPTDANDVTVTDSLSAGFGYASTVSILIGGVPTVAVTSPSAGDDSLLWDLFTIPAGETLELTFTADVAATVGPATYQNDTGATSSTASVTPFDPLLTTAEDVTVLAPDTGIIEGYVFEDVDDNGIFDPLIDVPLAGIEVYITDSLGTLYIVTTDETGFFSIVVAAGDATVDVQDSDLPAGLYLRFGFSDPDTVTVPDGGTATKDTGYVTLPLTADLSITKTDSVDPVIAGNNLTYTITVQNAGPADANNVVVTDTLPAGVTFVSTSGCTEDPNGVPTCTLGTIAAGGSAAYTVTVTVDSDTTGTVTNNVSVTSTTTESDNSNNSASEDTSVNAETDLLITKTDSVDPVVAGNNLTYTVTVQNNGPSDAQNVVVTDTMPAGVSFVSSSGCTEDPNGIPTCTLGTIAAGGSAAYTVTVTVDSDTTGTITNNVSVTSDTTLINTGDDSASEDTTVNAEADLSVTKTDSVDPVVAGNSLAYTVTVTNSGPSDAQNVVVTDTLPAGVTFVSTSGCAEDPNGVPTCSLGTITSGGSAQYTVTVTVDSDTTGTITNNVSVASDTSDPDSNNNSTTEDTAVNAEADLVITKSDNPDPVTAGNNLTYTVTVQNNGPSDAQNVVVTDTLPAGVSFVSTSGCTEDPNGVPTCTLGTIAAGGSAPYTVTVTVNSATSGTITNTVSVTSSTPLINTGDDSASEDTTVNASADLSITKTDSIDPVTAGNNLTYTVTVQNNGPSDAQSVIVTDTLPAGVTFVSTTGCAEDPNGIPACTLGTITAGGSAQYTVTVTTDPGLTEGTVLTNNATVSSSTPDPDNGNNVTSEDTTIGAGADLSITKTDSIDPVIAGNNLTYTVTVSNAGPNDAQNVVVTDTLPAGVTFVSSSGCTEDPNGVPTCSLGTITAGGSAQYTVTVSVDSDTTGTITNNGTASSDTPDPDGSNNDTSEDTAVTAEADLSVIKSDSPDPVDPGQNLTYTITVSNAGPSDAQNVVVTDTLPAGVTFVSTTGCAEDPNGMPACSLGTITAGNSGQYTVTVTVDSTTTGTLTNSVSAGSDANDPNTGNNDDSEDTTVNAPSIFDPPSSFKTVNDLGFPELEWRMVWINNSNVTATAVRVTDPIPFSTTYVPASVSCDARGSSSTTTCMYDSTNNQVVWEGTIAPDPGATNEFDAANEVVITFRTTMSAQVTFVENQGCANWDENGDGSTADEISSGQTPVCSDDPTTALIDDPTVWTAPSIRAIPAINEWGMIIFMLFAGIVSLLSLRRQKSVS